MQRRKDDIDMGDTANKLITFSHRTLYVVLWTVALTVSVATAGYFGLNAKANEALDLANKHEQVLNNMACDVRQLKNYMIYSVRPAASDQCNKNQR